MVAHSIRFSGSNETIGEGQKGRRTMSSFEEPTEWIEREWELRKRNEEIEERQKHTREDLEVEVALLKNEEEGGSKETSALAKSLQKCKTQNEKLSKELDFLRKERSSLLSDLKVARLQLRKPPPPTDPKTSASEPSAAELERECAGLRREAEEARREAKKEGSRAQAEAVRAARADEEAAKAREAKRRAEEDVKELRQTLEAAKSDNQRELRAREKKHSQLLLAFKKQAELVHVLRQQKLHLEASRVLDLSEEEFINNLDWKHQLESPANSKG